MTPSDRASVREATLREAANTCLSHNGCQRWGGLSCYSECHRADSQAILALIHHPAPDPPSDALTLERVRYMLVRHVPLYTNSHWTCLGCGEKFGSIAGSNRWVEHVLALLAAPRTEKP